MARPFNSSSPWNIAIGSGAEFQSKAGIETATMEHQPGTVTLIVDDAVSIYQSKNTDPLATWTYDSHEPSADWQFGGQESGSFQIQTPSNLQFQTVDGWAVLELLDGQHYIETWHGVKNNNFSYQASYIVENKLDGTGISLPGEHDGIRAGGTSLLAGLVTKDDLDALSVDHAVAMGLPTSFLKASNDPSQQYVWPATSADSGGAQVYTGIIPMGALFAIPKTVELSKSGITTPEGMALAKAFQTYGGYVSDTTVQTTPTVQLAYLQTGASQNQIHDLQTDAGVIRNLLQLVTNNSAASIGGGSTAPVGSGSTAPVGNGSVSASAPCYVTGTNILTDRGEVAVEKLQVNDKVITASGETRSIRWIGTRTYSELTVPQSDRPVRIRAGALADGMPSRDLLVSPDHALLVDGLFVAAGHLVNGISVIRGEAVAELTYWHIELDYHDLLIAENTPAESFLPAEGVRQQFDGEHSQDFGRSSCQPFAPRVEAGTELGILRRSLILRAGLSLDVPGFGDLRGSLDLCEIHGCDLRVAGWARDKAHPNGPVCIDIVVDGIVATMALAEVYRPDLAAAGEGAGWHGFDLGLDTTLLKERLTPGMPRTVEVRRSADRASVGALRMDNSGAWIRLMAPDR